MAFPSTKNQDYGVWCMQGPTEAQGQNQVYICMKTEE